MDWGSLAGLVLGLAAIILGQWVEGGQIGSLIQPAPLVIVLGGTLGAVLLQNGLVNLVRGVRLLRSAFVPQADFYPALITTIHAWSTTARMEGFLKLDNHINAHPDPFIAKGLRLVVDGIEPQKTRDILDIDISSYEREQRLAIKVWDAAGGYAPTIGILGAVLGVGLANLVFLPIANKLKRHLQLEILKREMLADAFLCIKEGDHPNLIQERMSSYWHRDH
jgi:chemotaxis protein MotA